MGEFVVKFLSCVGGGPHERVVEALRNLGEDAGTHEILSAEGWRRCFGRGKLGRLVARGLGFGVFPVLALGHALKQSCVGVSGRPLSRPMLVATTNPFFLPHVLVATRRFHRCGVVALLYDMYPDALEAAGIEHGWLSRVMTRANRWLVSHADGVVYLGEVQRANAEKRYGVGGRTRLIPTGGSRSEFESAPASLDPSLVSWMSGRCVFSYVGNMGVMHDVATMERAIPEYLDGLDASSRGRVGFVFAATGPGVSRLQKAFGDRYSDSVRFVGPLLDGPWADLLRRTDVALASLTPQACATSIPSKIQSALLAGCIPLVVAPAGADIARLVRGEELVSRRCGLVVEPGDVRGLVGAFERLSRAENRADYAEGVESASSVLDVGHLSRTWRAFLSECSETAPMPWALLGYRAAKRTFDVAASFAGLVCCAPILAVTAIGVRFRLGSPVFFRQQRPGLNGRPFELIKFRTMKNAEGPIDASRDGERLTPFGRTLRALSLDELPTLFNVLKGDMSLVGPRPLLMSYLERYDETQAQRMWVKPGVTGHAQVHGRNALSWEEKFALDVWYVHHASCALDLKIVLQTIFAVLKRSGIQHANSATMPEFMGNVERPSRVGETSSETCSEMRQEA